MLKFGTKHVDYDMVKMLSSILQVNYPDVLGQAYVCNAPTMFTAVWAVVKRFIDPVTASKMIMCSYKKLREYLDEDQILSDIGNKNATSSGTSSSSNQQETVEDETGTEDLPPPPDFSDISDLVQNVDINADTVQSTSR